MAENLILGFSFLNHFSRFCLVYMLFSTGVQTSFYGLVQGDEGVNNTFPLSSFVYQKTVLKPFDWRYIRVNLPPWFSSVSIALESDVDLDLKVSRSSPLMICFREGSPPVPDVYDSNVTGLVLDYLPRDSFGSIRGLQITEQCYPMQKNLSVRLTIEQISPGTWYFGLFNGIGPMRTQSKMINPGRSYSFSGNISVDGCKTPLVLGQFCNQTVDSLSCTNRSENDPNDQTSNQLEENIVACRSVGGRTCHGDDESKLFSLNVVGMAEKLIIKASNVTSNNGIFFISYARHGAIPLSTLHDYSGNISEAPLIIESPKLGRWYVMVQPVISSNRTGAKVCYSLEWQVIQCPLGTTGPNCTFKTYMLQAVLRKNPSLPFEAFYLPVSGKVSDGANFPVEPLLSNSFYVGNTSDAWTFFMIDVPSGAAGGNIHIHLVSDAVINYGVYVRYDGLPSLNNWDYFFANSSSNGNSSVFFKSYDSTENSISFYVLYAREGTWSIGLRHLNSDGPVSQRHTTMSISLERCPQKCSSHGSCENVLDASGLTIYSYCFCDRDHGGFDCGIELVTHKGHVWQSISLIASNAAAILPAYWAIRHKAFAEWVIYTSSGISSGLYHACDVGTWCALPFHVLQFMDFWLSFMAVASTFIYLSAIDELSKRTIHTVVAILTALMAENGPTRSSNIALVIAIGALGLLIGWLIEFCTHYRSSSQRFSFSLNMIDRFPRIGEWLLKVVKKLLKRFSWGFLLAGFAAVAMAATSWHLETTQTYWIWHSLWHVSIYTASFLFLCSKVEALNCEIARPSDGPPDEHYVLTRQDSSVGRDHR